MGGGVAGFNQGEWGVVGYWILDGVDIMDIGDIKGGVWCHGACVDLHQSTQYPISDNPYSSRLITAIPH